MSPWELGTIKPLTRLIFYYTFKLMGVLLPLKLYCVLYPFLWLSLTFSDSMDMGGGRATESERQAVWVVRDLHNPGQEKTSQTSAPYVCVYTCVLECLCVCSLTPWPWWRPAAAGSAVCRRTGWSWFPPRRRAWGTAGPRWWCGSSCPPAGQPSGRTDGKTEDKSCYF